MLANKKGATKISRRDFLRDKFEEFKIRFCELEGWDPTTRYPTRNTLEAPGLDYVADEPEEDGRLGEI
jgi:hypothetical protein